MCNKCGIYYATKDDLKVHKRNLCLMLQIVIQTGDIFEASENVIESKTSFTQVTKRLVDEGNYVRLLLADADGLLIR